MNHDVIVDRKGMDEQKFQQDLVECRVYAGEVNTVAEAAHHGAVGAVVGGAIGAAVGNSRTVERLAGAGAIGGSVKGATRAEYRKEHVLNNCLRGRGRTVGEGARTSTCDRSKASNGVQPG